MDILVACEESQAVCKELRKLGHNAYSCDIQGCSGGHPEWHIKGDVIGLLNGNCVLKFENGDFEIKQGKWDMIIAFPPCTHLAVSGARHFEKKREDGRQRDGIEFFCKFLMADCDKIAIENPVNIISGFTIFVGCKLGNPFSHKQVDLRSVSPKKYGWIIWLGFIGRPNFSAMSG